MKTLTLSFLILLAFALCLMPVGPVAHTLHAQTTIPGGVVSGLWTYSGSPYMVNGEISVPDSQALTIQPGVEVIFTGHHQFFIDGQLLAIGVPDSMITFTAQDTSTGWLGIEFRNIPLHNDSSKLVYCKVSRAFNRQTTISPEGRGVGVRGSNQVVVSHCEITHNTIIGDNTTGGAGLGISNCTPVITHNFIAYNKAMGGHGGGVVINIPDSLKLVLANNLIYKNVAHGGAGVACAGDSRPILINNTIVNNSGHHGAGVDFVFGSAVLINTIVYGNESTENDEQVHFGYNYTASFFNCLIEGGRAKFAENHMPGAPSFSGRYSYILDGNPEFVNPENDFHLSDYSECIGWGLLSKELNGVVYYAPGTDYDLNPRPWPAGSKPDIGAFENPRDTAIGMAIDREVSIGAIFRPVYPNPASGEISIPYTLQRAGQVSMEIWDMNGRRVEVLKDAYQVPGAYVERWDVSGLPNGVYGCRLRWDGEMASQLIVVQK